MNRLLALFIPWLLVACAGDPAGSACEFRGSGFHASTNCKYRCLETRTIECPGGDSIRPAVCSGETGCQPGGCAQGAICYSVQDPFNDESFCMPADLCGEFSDARYAAWEKEKQASAAALRAEYAERKRLREKNPATTAPAATTFE